MIGVKLPGRKVEFCSRKPIELKSTPIKGCSTRSFLLIVMTVSAIGCGNKSTTSFTSSFEFESPEPPELYTGVAIFGCLLIRFGAAFFTFTMGFTTVLAFLTDSFLPLVVGCEQYCFLRTCFLADWERKIRSDC